MQVPILPAAFNTICKKEFVIYYNESCDSVTSALIYLIINLHYFFKRFKKKNDYNVKKARYLEYFVSNSWYQTAPFDSLAL